MTIQYPSVLKSSMYLTLSSVECARTPHTFDLYIDRMKLMTYAGEHSDISIALYATNYHSLIKYYWYNIAYTYTPHADGHKLMLEHKEFYGKIHYVFGGVDNIKRAQRISNTACKSNDE